MELMWDQMWRSTMNYGRKGVAVQAISAVDLALWDLCGKVRNEPVYQLLGGNTKPSRLPVYATTVRCVRPFLLRAARMHRHVVAIARLLAALTRETS